ncbi:MAG: 3'-5' exonuclease [Clostridia bacterium]
MPYRLCGGTPFYQRMEIKDILCYLRLIANDKDYVAAERILNVEARDRAVYQAAQLHVKVNY